MGEMWLLYVVISKKISTSKTRETESDEESWQIHGEEFNFSKM